MKRAQAGISVLIIFIAVILTAAVAAMVYISVSNTLQQRSLAVGSEAQERVSRGLEVMEILAIADMDTRTVYGFELLVRTLPASSSMRQDRIFFQIGSYDVQQSVTVQSTDAADYEERSHTTDLITDTNWTVPSLPKVGMGSVAIGTPDALFTLTIDGAQVAQVPVPSGVFTAVYNETTDLVYGYITRSGNTFTFANAHPQCRFDHVIRDVRFCFEEVSGDGDMFLDRGETWKVVYRLSQPSPLGEGEFVDIRLMTDRGYVADIQTRLPNVFTQSAFAIWP